MSLSAVIAKIQEGLPGILLRLAILGNWLSTKFNKDHPLFHASFATLSELKNLLSRQMDGAYLFLGIGEYGHILRVKSTEARRELGNVMVIGRTRCGKGLFAISQILSWTESLIVNDIKGELRAQTAGYRATDGRPVFTFDPTGCGDRYDPFLGKVTEDDLRDAATKLLARANEGENAIFTMRAVTMLTQLFLAARLEETPLLPYVQRAIYAGPVDTAKRLHAISLQHNHYPNLSTRFLDMSLADMAKRHFDDKFFISAWSNMSHRLEPILTDIVLRSLSGSDFTAKDIIMGEKPATLYLCWPERSLLTLSPLIQLVWGSLLDEMMYLYDAADEVQRRKMWQVFNLMDEAGRTGIPLMHEYCATGVGRKQIFWMAYQSPAQVDAVYGRNNANTIWDNMDTQIFYRPPNHKTAKELREFLGDVSGFSHSTTSREGQEASESKVEQAVALLSAQDVRKLDNEEVLIFHSNLAPIRTQRMDFRRFPHLLDRMRIAPPPLQPLAPIRQRMAAGFGQGTGETHAEFVNPEQYV